MHGAMHAILLSSVTISPLFILLCRGFTAEVVLKCVFIDVQKPFTYIFSFRTFDPAKRVNVSSVRVQILPRPFRTHDVDNLNVERRFMRYRACWMMQRFAEADFQDPQTILRCLNCTMQVKAAIRFHSFLTFNMRIAPSFWGR